MANAFITDAKTGLTIERPLTDEELENVSHMAEASQAEKQAELDRAKAKAEVIAKLGLTPDEVAALLS
jgi:hypothetical protein